MSEPERDPELPPDPACDDEEPPPELEWEPPESLRAELPELELLEPPELEERLSELLLELDERSELLLEPE